MNRKFNPAIIYGVVVLPIIIPILVMNGRFASSNITDNYSNTEAALPRLKHLKMKMHSGAAEFMQRIFPEGYLFMNALYRLTVQKLVP